MYYVSSLFRRFPPDVARFPFFSARCTLCRALHMYENSKHSPTAHDAVPALLSQHTAGADIKEMASLSFAEAYGQNRFKEFARLTSIRKPVREMGAFLARGIIWWLAVDAVLVSRASLTFWPWSSAQQQPCSQRPTIGRVDCASVAPR